MTIAQKISEALGKWLHRYFLLLLLACYLIAGFLPAPGVWLSNREFPIGRWPGTLQTILLALALFISAWHLGHRKRSSSSNQVASRHSFLQFTTMLAAVVTWRILWLGLAVLASVLSNNSPIALGLVLVLGMPTALSAVPWTDKVGGDVGLTLVFLFASLLIAPLLLAGGWQVLELLGLSRDAASSFESTAWWEGPLHQIAWFAPPVACGFMLGRSSWLRPLDLFTPITKLIPPLVILLLNYINASRVIPQLSSPDSWGLFAFAAASVFAVVTGIMLGSRYLATRLRCPRPMQLAVTFSSGMYNTGMAMVLAATWLADVPELLIPILLFTLGQHVSAAFAERFEFEPSPLLSANDDNQPGLHQQVPMTKQDRFVSSTDRSFR